MAITFLKRENATGNGLLLSPSPIAYHCITSVCTEEERKENKLHYLRDDVAE